MKDSKGNIITIGDRVKVHWNFDNKIHNGHVFRIRGNVVEIDISARKISVSDPAKITKIRIHFKNQGKMHIGII